MEIVLLRTNSVLRTVSVAKVYVARSLHGGESVENVAPEGLPWVNHARCQVRERLQFE